MAHFDRELTQSHAPQGADPKAKTVSVATAATDPLSTGAPAPTDPAIPITIPPASSGPPLAAKAGLPSVPGYMVIEEIARGGMGVVYRAHDPAFDREVAIKVMHPGQHAGRFVVESRVTARLPHPGVPPVHALGRLADGRPFLVLKLIRGRTLADELKAAGPADLPRLLNVFEHIGQTVGFAHAQGIIHRDLKPSNIMVGSFGEVQVMDWGLAREIAPSVRGPSSLDIREGNSGKASDVLSNDEGRRTTDDVDRRHIDTVITPSTPSDAPTPFVTATAAGQVKGTPAYMAPEQARGEAVDARADVFALGGILAAMLTGHPPFAGRSAVDTLHKAARADLHGCFARLEESGADPQLTALARQCMAAVPDDRPTTGAAVAEAIAAYRAGVEERLRKTEQERLAADVKAAEQRKRRRVQWALAGAIVLFLAAGGVGSGFASLWRTAEAAKTTAFGAMGAAEEQREIAEHERTKAVVARDQLALEKVNTENARDDAFRQKEKVAAYEYGLMIQVAHQLWRDNKLAEARALLARTDPKLRGWEYNYVHRLCHAESVVLKHQAPGAINDGTAAAAFSRDGSLVLTVNELGAVCVWDAKTGAELSVLKSNATAMRISSASFSPDGSRVVTAGADGGARVWDAKTGAEAVILKGPRVRTVGEPTARFSPDGSRVVAVSGGFAARAQVWDARTGDEIRLLKGDNVRPPPFNRTLAVASQLSPDGSRVLSACSDGTARIWDVKSEGELLVLKGQNASYSPDGSRVITIDGAVGGWTVRMWDAKTGAEIVALKHAKAVYSAKLSPDRSRIVTTCQDGAARVWDAMSGAELTVIKGLASDPTRAFFGTDGSLVLTFSSRDAAARVWDAKTGAEKAVLRGHSAELLSANFSADGSRAATTGFDNTARIWDVKTGAELAILKGHTGASRSALFSPDGSRLVTASADGTARVWGAKNGAEIAILKGHAKAVLSATFSPDGSRVVTASADGTARIWDAKTGAQAAVLRGHTGWVLSALFTPDGTSVVTLGDGLGFGDSTARTWDATTGALMNFKNESVALSSASFSADGTRIVTVCTDGTARVWDSRSGAELAVLKGHARAPASLNQGSRIVASASFSPDGSRVVTAGEDRTVRIWDSKSGAELAVFKGPGGASTSVSFSPDGSRLIVSDHAPGANGGYRLWDASSGAEIAVLKGQLFSPSFSPDGSLILTPSRDATVRVWDAKTGAPKAVLRGHAAEIRSASFSPNGSRVVTASYDTTARVWDAKTGAELTALRGHTGIVHSASFSPDGSRVLTASADGTARMWDEANDATEAVLLRGLNGAAFPRALSASLGPEGTRVVGAGVGGKLRVWDGKSGDMVTVLQGDAGSVTWASFSSDGSRIIASGKSPGVVPAAFDATTRIWDARSGAEIAVLKGHKIDVRAASFSRDNSRVVTAGNDGTARVWDAKTGAELTVLKGHFLGVISVSFSPDGSRVVTASADGTARVWDAKTGVQLGMLKVQGWTKEAALRQEQNLALNSASFSPDGARIVTGGVDGMARIWDPKTGAEAAVLVGHTGSVSSASFSPDGTRVVTADADGAIRVWDAKSGAAVAALRGHPGWLHSASFTHDGSRIVTTGLDGTVRVWDSRPFRNSPPSNWNG